MGKQYGFVIVTKASELNPKSRAPRMRFGCERGGWYRKHEKKYDEGKVVKRMSNSTGTKKCGCPFELRCVRGNDGWKVSVANGKHNHPSALHMEGHAYAGRLSSEETSLLVEMSRSLVKPRDILNSLKHTNSGNTSTIKSIYNARAKYRVQELAGRSQMQQLMKKLADYEYIEWHRTNEENVLTEMFWAHPTSGDLLRAFPHVLLMYCTYKTNRYRYPLLQICGVTFTHLTFTAAFAFMEGEKQENYEWALEKLKGMLVESPTVIVSDRELALMNAIANVFPDAVNLICLWHINKNIVAKYAKIIGKNKWSSFEAQWKSLVYSPTIEWYEQQLSILKRDYAMFPRAIAYLENTWLKDHKERFVQAWTDKVMHFGNTTTSR